MGLGEGERSKWEVGLGAPVSRKAGRQRETRSSDNLPMTGRCPLANMIGERGKERGRRKGREREWRNEGEIGIVLIKVEE